MIDLRRLFQRDARDSYPSTGIAPGPHHPIAELQGEYGAVVRALFARAGITPQSVHLDLRHLGSAPDERPVFLAMVRLVAWDRPSSLRLSLGLPLLERSLRRQLRGSWLLEVSHFGGLWLHASTPLQEDPDALRELRALVVSLGVDGPGGPRLADTAWGPPG